MKSVMHSVRLAALAVLACGSVLAAAALYGATTINATNHCAWAANLGWMEARGDATSGAVVGEYVCSGCIYGANVGWINLGNGSPANGIGYQNGSASDFGVNHDGLGNLRGAAWGANIGWIHFEDTGAPKVDLATGRLSGYAYSANCGWISLSNAQAQVQTDAITGGADTDEDGIPDAWELTQFGALEMADERSNADGDGLSDRREYLADTNPHDPRDVFCITACSFEGGTPGRIALAWTCQPTRCYAVERRAALTPDSPWEEVCVLAPPGIGHTVLDQGGNSYFYRVRAIRPLAW